jgi:hypothetical protein
MAARKFRMVSAQESGIGGFLLFFALTQVVATGVVAWQIPSTAAEVFGPDGAIVSRMDPNYVPLVSAELLLQIARGVAFIIGLVLLFRRDPRTPKFYKAVLGGIIAIATLDMYFASRSVHAMEAWLAAHGRPTAKVDDALSKGQMENIRGIVYGVIWFLYWRSSERVRLTFAPASGMTEIPKPT